tara:strand:+ start:2121 stop:2363 length:243 start_codon:yes stop_codon:yes gene_type:complete
VNQAVQMQDGYRQVEETMVLQVIVSGMMMQCHISNLAIDDMPQFYQDYQFDIEERINERVEEEEWDESGIIHIHANTILG